MGTENHVQTEEQNTYGKEKWKTEQDRLKELNKRRQNEMKNKDTWKQSEKLLNHTQDYLLYCGYFFTYIRARSS
jgi:hypothetical protein